MPTVLGLFSDRGQALATIEALRFEQHHVLDHVRLVGGSPSTEALATETPPGTVVDAGPTASIVESLFSEVIPGDRRRTLRSRLDDGAVLVAGQDLDEGAAEDLRHVLRQHGAAVIDS